MNVPNQLSQTNDVSHTHDVVPISITFAHATLTLAWSNLQVTLDGPLLRAACRCAQCRMQKIRAESSDENHHAGVTVTAVSSMGYGLQLHFSDGHDRGIYPWAYLLEISGRTQSLLPSPQPSPSRGEGVSQ